MWSHVWGENQNLTNRLLLNTTYPCINVSGTIDRIAEAPDDGDYHIDINLDPQYAFLLNKSNVIYNDGDLVTEVICAGPGRELQSVCNGFNQSYLLNNIYVGKHINIIGAYVSDLGADGWKEIHPITSIDCNVAWDVNEDGIVNIQDIVLVAQHFGEITTSPYPRYDVNTDGIVNIQDIVLVAQHFGQTTCWK